MDYEKLNRAYSKAYAEFQIEFLHEGSIAKEGRTTHNGVLTVKHIETSQTAGTRWSGKKSVLSNSMGKTVLKFIAKHFPQSETARLVAQSYGQGLMKYAPDSDPKDSSFGYLAHVALRKLCDSPATSLLYRTLARASGTPAFGAFSKGLEHTLKELFFEEEQQEFSQTKLVAIETIAEKLKSNLEEVLGAFSSMAAEASRYGSRLSEQGNATVKRLEVDIDAITELSAKQQETLVSTCGDITLCLKMMNFDDFEGLLGFILQGHTEEQTV